MKILIIGGSSFIGKNLIESAPKSWDIHATYNSSEDFQVFIKKYSNVKAIKLDLFKDDSADLEDYETVLYLAGISPGQSDNIKIDGLNKMDYLHAQAIPKAFNLFSNCKKFIYFSSGIYYLLNDLSDYRKSRLAGEVNVKLSAKLNNCNYIIVRNMEIYGKYMASHKIYRTICNSAINGVKEIKINGDGNNFIDTMYIDDYIEIIIRIIKSDIEDETIDICKSNPVTIRELVNSIYNVMGKEKPTINCSGLPTENTDFILSNKKMIKLLNMSPKISLEEGLKKWIDNGLK